MKNIHVLKTDKPSRIIKGQDNVFILLDTYAPNWFEINLKTTKQNIYITCDEEIKEGDWFICQNGFEKKCVGTTIINNEVYLLDYLENTDRLIWCKKIILTTDVDLIKDGVQAIPDEFLEWFVKNPSCEEVEVEIESKFDRVDGHYHDVWEIIIQKEEPKQYSKYLSCCRSEEECYCKDESKQEKLEEDAKDCLEQNGLPLEGDFAEGYVVGSIFGSKWQKEQDKNKFSEEEVINIANWAFGFHRRNDLTDSELETEFNRILSERINKK